METRNCISSSNKVFGKVVIDDNKIIIQHQTKPELIIDDIDIINQIKNNDNQAMLTLYDKYELCIGEIAALFNKSYSSTRTTLNKMNPTTGPRTGRRNSSYGTKHSEETKRKIGEKSKGRVIPQYERTPEIREKISKGVKKYYAEHGVSEETRKKLSQAWVDGKYENSPMGRGIQGHFVSIKNNKKFFFRSLLELCYYLKLEEDINVKEYEVEPFRIALDGNHHYTPDVLINNKNIIELKAQGFLKYSDSEERFEKEQKYAIEYAKKHNMTYQVVYDKEIEFDSNKFKRYLKNNPNIIEKYQISFTKDWSIK